MLEDSKSHLHHFKNSEENAQYGHQLGDKNNRVNLNKIKQAFYKDFQSIKNQMEYQRN